MELFIKYIGIQGILAFLLVAGYIAAPFASIILPDGYTEVATLVLGFYFAKNGVGIVGSFRKSG